MRFSLRWLFGVTSLVAVACACLIFASYSVATWLGLALHLFLLLSVLGAFYALRERRAFWGGCAIMGWYYLGSAYLPFELQPLRTTAARALWEIYSTVAREVPAESPVEETGDETEVTDETLEEMAIAVVRTIPDYELNFERVGHLLTTFLAAFTGGGVALWFDRRSSRKLDGPSPASLT